MARNRNEGFHERRSDGGCPGDTALAAVGGFAVLLLTAGSMGGPALADRPESGQEIVVVNRSHQAIDQLYVSPSDSDQWGENRLGNDSVHPGGSFRLRLPQNDRLQRGRAGDLSRRAAGGAGWGEYMPLRAGQLRCQGSRDAARGGGVQPRRDRVERDHPADRAFVPVRSGCEDWGDNRLMAGPVAAGTKIGIDVSWRVRGRYPGGVRQSLGGRAAWHRYLRAVRRGCAPRLDDRGRARTPVWIGLAGRKPASRQPCPAGATSGAEPAGDGDRDDRRHQSFRGTNHRHSSYRRRTDPRTTPGLVGRRATAPRRPPRLAFHAWP